MKLTHCNDFRKKELMKWLSIHGSEVHCNCYDLGGIVNFVVSSMFCVYYLCIILLKFQEKLCASMGLSGAYLVLFQEALVIVLH